MENKETKLLNLHKKIKKYNYYFLIFTLLVSLQIFVLPNDIVEKFPILNTFINFMKSHFEIVNYSYENLPTFVTFYLCEMSLLGLIYGACCFIYAIYFLGFNYGFWIKCKRADDPSIFLHENKSAPDQFITLILRPGEFSGLLIKNRFLFLVSLSFFLLMCYDLIEIKNKKGYFNSSEILKLENLDFFIFGIFYGFGLIWFCIAIFSAIFGIITSFIIDFKRLD
ncbi:MULTISPECIES: hypothetical protein [unclassified Campylobacter]|uniref:hypothetical protein n=1 Tax=unclassified Campylobacter TaxID=2593542 RepID=UPI0022E9FFAC|nr:MULTISPECIES: hypothetical protein [unclassified Campylobacter]MDA3061707.1 hypothetical protein [Campylobacter sp. JMF_14 EL1]MDA3073187.1 hypothetical protein [Campylobacter sp. JMF_10 EL2]